MFIENKLNSLLFEFFNKGVLFITLYVILLHIGGQEELLTKKIAELHPENDEAVDNTPRRTHNTNVTTFRRGKQPIRQEVIDSSRNFLQVK